MSSSTAQRVGLLRFGILCFFGFSILAFVLFNPVSKEDLFTHVNDRGETCVSDFLHYYQAAVLTVSDKRFLVYDSQVQLDSMNKIIAPRHINYCFYMQYPPFTFPILTPLALFSKENAYYVWIATSLSFGAAGLAVLNRLRPASTRLDAIDFSTMLLGFIASASGLVTFALGQSSWFLVGLYSLYFWGLRRNRTLLAGAALSLSTFKPQYTPLLMLPMLSKQRWKAVVAFCLVEFLQLLLAACAIGWENVVNYPHTLLHAESDPNALAGGYYAGQMVSLRNILSIFHNQTLTLTCNALVLLVMAPFVWLVWQKVWKDPNHQAFNWAATATIALTLLLSPHTHIYDLVILMCPLVLILTPLRSLFKPSTLSERMCNLILLTFPVTSWVLFASPLNCEFRSLALLLLVFCVFSVFNLKNHEPTSQPKIDKPQLPPEQQQATSHSAA